MFKAIMTTVALLGLASGAMAAPAAAPAAKPAMAAAKPAMAPAKPMTHATVTKTTAVHVTKTGKKITYDCTKAGNKNKTACKGKG